MEKEHFQSISISGVSLALLCARKPFQLALLLVWLEDCEQCNNAVEVG